MMALASGREIGLKWINCKSTSLRVQQSSHCKCRSLLGKIPVLLRKSSRAKQWDKNKVRSSVWEIKSVVLAEHLWIGCHQFNSLHFNPPGEGINFKGDTSVDGLFVEHPPVQPPQLNVSEQYKSAYEWRVLDFPCACKRTQRLWSHGRIWGSPAEMRKGLGHRGTDKINQTVHAKCTGAQMKLSREAWPSSVHISPSKKMAVPKHSFGEVQAFLGACLNWTSLGKERVWTHNSPVLHFVVS